METFFTSDWHLGHRNIIKYDGRPFDNIREMDETIIKNVTSQVEKGDMIYFLGDFAMTLSENEMEGHMKALSHTGAMLRFIKGNHDKRETIKLYEKYGVYLGEQRMVRVTDEDTDEGYQSIVLNHYAMRVWDKCHHGTWHLYGHSHHTLPDLKDSLSLDVGINGYAYWMLTYGQVKGLMAKKTFKPIDHHGKTGRV